MSDVQPDGDRKESRAPLIDVGMREAFGGATLKERSSVFARLTSRTRPAAPFSTPGRYDVVGEIARGGIGVVQQCRDADLGRDVAMKLLREDHVGDHAVLHRFIEEAQIGGKLEHPGIVPVYDVGIEGTRPYFTMKLIRGRTLAGLLAERPDPGHDRQRFLSIYLQVCQTVAYAHSRGVLHRDLKPSNVMVGAFGEVQVVDWGLAKVLDRPGDAARGESTLRAAAAITSVRRAAAGAADSETGSVMGTPAYMPPEQALGDVEGLDERADVFSLGAMLCEILTGGPPYPGEREAALRAAMRAETGPALRRLAECGAEPEMVALARECLAAARADRPRDAGVVATRVESFLARAQERAQAAQLEAAEARGRAGQERRARKLTVALGSTVVLALLVGAGAFGWSSSQRRERIARFDGRLHDALNETSLRLGRAQSSKAASDWTAALASAEQLASLAVAEESSVALQSEVHDAVEQVRAQAEPALQQLERTADRARLQTRLEELGAYDDEYSRERDWKSIDAEYAASFRDRGLDVDALPAADAATRAGELELREPLQFVVDDWSRVRSILQDSPGSKRLFELALAIDPDPVRAQLRRATREQDVETLKSMATSNELEQLPKPTLLLLGRDLGARGAIEESLRVLRVAYRFHPNDFDLLLDLVLLCRMPGEDRTQEAMQYLAAALALRPSSRRVRHALGDLRQHALHDAAGALMTFRDASAVIPEDLDLAVHVAHLLRATGEAEQAKTEFERIAEATPEDEKNVGSRLIALQELDRWDEARDASAAALEKFQNSARLRFEYARALERTGASQRAEEEYRKVLAADSRNEHAYRNLGLMLFFGKHDAVGAIALLREGLGHLPGSAVLLDALGYLLHMSGNNRDAVELLKRAIAAAPSEAEFHRHFADTLCALQENEKARGEYARAVALDPKDVVTRVNFGDLLTQLGDYDAAIEVLTEAIRLNGKVPETFTNRGNAWLGKHDLGQAEADFRAAILLRNDNAIAHYNLGRCRRAAKDLDEAIREFQRAAGLDTRDVDFQRELALTLRQARRIPEAIRSFRAAVALKPDDRSSSEILACSWWEVGNLDEAARQLEVLKARGGSSLRLLVLETMISMELGRGREALVSARAAVAKEPDYAALLVDTARTLHALGERELARRVATEGGLAESEPIEPEAPAVPEDDAAPDVLRASASAALAAGDEERRIQAVDWLIRAREQLRSAIDGDDWHARALALRELRRWSWDPGLAAVRDPERTSTLGEVERDELAELWATVDELLRAGVERAVAESN